MEAGLSRDTDLDQLRHPIYAAVATVAKEVVRLPPALRLGELSARAASANVTTASGKQIRFLPPDPLTKTGYEQQIFDTGIVPTRDTPHDLFNALAWLSFPKTKATLNRLHVEETARRDGTRDKGTARGPLSDLLTAFDESGAIVSCEATIADDLRAHRWRSLFWDHRERLVGGIRIGVLGHAVLEKALRPWPGITCKIILVPESEPDIDLAAGRWLEQLPPESPPRLLQPLPVFGLPGWSPETGDPAFYDDERWFRKTRASDRDNAAGSNRPSDTMGSGVG